MDRARQLEAWALDKSDTRNLSFIALQPKDISKMNRRFTDSGKGMMS